MSNAEVATVVSEPVVIHEGTYRLYEKPDGGLHLVYQRDDTGAIEHIDIPGMMVKLMNRAQEGNMNPLQMAHEMMKLRKA